MILKAIGNYDSLVPIFPNLSSYEIPITINYQFPKSTKAYYQGQNILFVLNKYSND